MKNKKTIDKSIFVLTASGLIEVAKMQNKDIWSELRLYAYKNNYNAILVDKYGGTFIKIEEQ